MITDALAELVRKSLEQASAQGSWSLEELPEPQFERPRKREHGDWSTNVALVVGKAAGSPRAAAEAIVEHLPPTGLIEKVEVAGPGFLNFYLAPVWLHEVVRRAADPSSRFGRAEAPTGQRFNVEYVSSNPTGPINVVSGRHAAVGDAIANLLEAVGHEVTREYYVNDAGRQMRLFAESLAAWYLRRFGVEAELPEDGYKGAYLEDLANDIAREVGDRYLESDDGERIEAMRRLGLARMLEAMRATLARFGTRHDLWFSEASLIDEGSLDATLEELRRKGFLEERDGAQWFLSSKLGDDKDRVVIKATGESTYLASDLPYLVNKFSRGFDQLLYLWGADHHGTVARLLAGAEALGHERERVEVRLVQIVSLLSEGEAIKASKRQGVLVPLDELLDDVGKDAARYTFLTRSLESPLDFDIALAKEKAPENPVYYVQYAHARICSILRRASEEGVSADPRTADLTFLAHPSEDDLMRKLASFEEVLPEAAAMRAPQRVTRYLEELASDFSAFYRDCKVMTEEKELTQARLALCVATREVLVSGLDILGVDAPESM